MAFGQMCPSVNSSIRTNGFWPGATSLDNARANAPVHREQSTIQCAELEHNGASGELQLNAYCFTPIVVWDGI